MHFRLVFAFALLVLTSPTAIAQPPAPALDAKKVDPVQLLVESARNIQKLDNFSTTLVGSLNVLQGEQKIAQQEVIEIKLSKPNKYSIKMVKPLELFTVKANGSQTLTHVAEIKRYMLTDETSGISDFAGTQLAGMVGNRFAGLVFSLLDTESTKKIVESLSESKYVGTVKQGEAILQHCRYTAGDSQFEVWFSTGEAPIAVLVKPDLSGILKKMQEAQDVDKFELSFELKDIDTKTTIPASAFALEEPAESEEVDDLFAAPEPRPHGLLGKKAPVFDTLNPAGTPIDIGSMVGKKVIILDFWATWCGPCIRAMPIIDKVAKEFADKGVVFYAVNQGEDAATVNAFLKEREFEIKVAMDPEGKGGNAYSVEGLPTSVLIGKDGRVQVVHVGFSPALEKTLRQELQALVAGKDLAKLEIAEWEKKMAEKKAKRAKRAAQRKREAAAAEAASAE